MEILLYESASNGHERQKVGELAQNHSFQVVKKNAETARGHSLYHRSLDVGIVFGFLLPRPTSRPFGLRQFVFAVLCALSTSSTAPRLIELACGVPFASTSLASTRSSSLASFLASATSALSVSSASATARSKDRWRSWPVGRAANCRARSVPQLSPSLRRSRVSKARRWKARRRPSRYLGRAAPPGERPWNWRLLGVGRPARRLPLWHRPARQSPVPYPFLWPMGDRRRLPVRLARPWSVAYLFHL